MTLSTDSPYRSIGVASPSPSSSPARKRRSALEVTVSTPRAILKGCLSGSASGVTVRDMLIYAGYCSDVIGPTAMIVTNVLAENVRGMRLAATDHAPFL